MNRTALIDTNIILDAAMSERPGRAAATLLLDEIAHGALTGYVTALSLKDVYYILTKYFDEPSAREFVAAALDAFEILPIDESICRIAIASDEPDFEDGLIRASAEVAPVDFIISRDERAFRRSTIKRMSAQEYVDAFCDTAEVEF